MSSTSQQALGRPSYREISLYKPDRTPCAIDLSDNTNLFGVPPTALRVLQDAGPAAISRYPAPFADDLKSALAHYAGVVVDEVATGCGSDDVLDSALRAFTEPGDTIAFPDPTFAMLPTFARMNGLVAAAVPLTEAFDFDADAMLGTGAKAIYLCSPNNPTGTAASPATIERIIRGASGLVILDEAYAEFAGEGWAAQSPRHDRLLVTRTLSKAFGLAGLRIGYATGAAHVIAEVEKSRGPFKVNSLAERAAVAALTHDRSWIAEQIDSLRSGRASFIEALRARGLSPLPSAANFVLVPVAHAAALAAKMRSGGVGVRPFERLHGIGDALRFTIGPAAMMEAGLRQLDEAMS